MSEPHPAQPATPRPRSAGKDRGLASAFLLRGEGRTAPLPTEALQGAEPRSVPWEEIWAAPQARQHFPERHVAQLADSIEQTRLVHAPVVRPMANPQDPRQRWLLVSGECRWRAWGRLRQKDAARWARMPVTVGEYDAEEAQLVALDENGRQLRLSPWERARAYRFLTSKLEAEAGQPLDVRTLATRLHAKRSSLNDFLRIAEAFDDATIRDAGHVTAEGALDPSVVATLSRAALMGVVKNVPEREARIAWLAERRPGTKAPPAREASSKQLAGCLRKLAATADEASAAEAIREMPVPARAELAGFVKRVARALEATSEG